MTTHGEIKSINGRRVATAEYRSWQMMKNRCLNPRARDFRYYGGRGIGLCARWHEYLFFLADMGRRPTKAHTLERKNTNLGYSKSNCIWATRRDQSRNRRYTKLDLTKVSRIKKLYATGRYRQVDLADMFSVCQRTISLIVRNESWQ